VIVNIEGTALAMGNTAYDLLSRLPGVTVSDGNISIQGKAGVKILIDGKLQQVSGQQLMNILKSMNASQIDKMEVLKKPPVKYDAAGTGGMINIKTNKLKLVGFSGSVFGSYSQGFFGNASGGFTLNYKGKKFNFFSGVTANKDARHFVNNTTNTINYNATETTIDQVTVTKSHGHFETYNLGTDWFINKSNSIGIKINGAFGLGLDDNTTNTSISDNSLGYQKQYSIQINQTHGFIQNSTLMPNICLIHLEPPFIFRQTINLIGIFMMLTSIIISLMLIIIPPQQQVYIKPQIHYCLIPYQDF